jgi:hypothetical protein
MDLYPNGFMWPSRRALLKSATLAEKGMENTMQHIEATQYSDEEIKLFVAHGRSDIALTAHLVVESHKQLVKISRGVWLIAVILLLIALK